MSKDYYKILHIRKEASVEEVKKAYKKLALIHHPDKNQCHDTETFKEINEAYEVLSDIKKRKAYDKSREFNGSANGWCGSFYNPFNGCEPMHNLHTFAPGYFSSHMRFWGSVGPIPTMNNNFGSFNYNSSHSSFFQDPPVEHNLDVTLEDIYNRTTKKMKISRLVLQPDYTFKREDKVFYIYVLPHWKTGTRVTFAREGDQGYNKIPADVVFVINVKPHPLFECEGHNIMYKCSISLLQALCGTIVEIPTLSTAMVDLDLTNEVVNPGTVKVLKGFGLPIPNESSKNGDLMVSFDIKFPQQVSTVVQAFLRNNFPNC